MNHRDYSWFCFPSITYQAVLLWLIFSRWQSSSSVWGLWTESSGDSLFPVSQSEGIRHTDAQDTTLLSLAVKGLKNSQSCLWSSTCIFVLLMWWDGHTFLSIKITDDSCLPYSHNSKWEQCTRETDRDRETNYYICEQISDKETLAKLICQNKKAPWCENTVFFIFFLSSWTQAFLLANDYASRRQPLYETCVLYVYIVLFYWAVRWKVCQNQNLFSPHSFH